jgi:hypothetical protein
MGGIKRKTPITATPGGRPRACAGENESSALWDMSRRHWKLIFADPCRRERNDDAPADDPSTGKIICRPRRRKYFFVCRIFSFASPDSP